MGWKGEDGKPVAVELDINEELGRGPNFTSKDPKKMKGVFADFRDHVFRVFKDVDDSDDEAGVANVKKSGGKKELVEMERNAYGEPFLPSAFTGRLPREPRGDWYLRALRSFITYSYGEYQCLVSHHGTKVLTIFSTEQRITPSCRVSLEIVHPR
jgi:hypothetical protein